MNEHKSTQLKGNKLVNYPKKQSCADQYDNVQHTEKYDSLHLLHL